MNIEELKTKLNQIQRQYGNLEVCNGTPRKITNLIAFQVSNEIYIDENGKEHKGVLLIL